MPELTDPSPSLSPRAAVLDVLTKSVRAATGIPTATGRPGQIALTEAIVDAMMAQGEHTAGAAPVGVGKSFAALAPAAWAAATRGQRTIISTESLSLQAQIITKDAPVVVAAVEAATGIRPVVEVLKGWGNYVCAMKALTSADTILDEAGAKDRGPLSDAVALPEEMASKADAVRRGVPGIASNSRRGPTVDLGAGPVDRPHARALISWALDSIAKGDASDRHSYDGPAGDGLWPGVSVTSTDCLGADACPLAAMCAPRLARDRVAEADIIVTNHAMLAVQAAKSAPIVVGNKFVGPINSIIIDEAHTLASIVRSQGSCEVSAASVRGVASALGKAFDARSPEVSSLLDDGANLASGVDEVLRHAASALKPGGVHDLGDTVSPLNDLGEMLEAWGQAVGRMAGAQTNHSNVKIALGARRAASRATSFVEAVKLISDHEAGIARWLEAGMDSAAGPALKASPVDVGGLLNANLWTAYVPFDDTGEPIIDERHWLGPVTGGDDSLSELDGDMDEPSEDGGGDDRPRYALSVIAMSGTLPQSSARDLGLRGQVVKYESPFADAYGSSMLYIPRAVTQEDIQAVCGPHWSPGRKVRLDSKAHVAWAAGHVEALVKANGGRALVLSATAAAGKEYVAKLRASRALGAITVYSQWDGVPASRLVAQWRADETSVLVGTKSLMTGTDAPGRTCSLVILDRVPRAPGNPVDDARAEVIQERLAVSKWDADRYVYAQDAALLIEQSAGRLIRSGTDSGMVAVLDPRLLKTGEFSYPGQTRALYLRALESFAIKTADLHKAEAFLAGLGATAAGAPRSVKAGAA